MDRTKIVIAGVLTLLIISLITFGVYRLIQNNVRKLPVAVQSPNANPSGFRAIIATPTPKTKTSPNSIAGSQPQTGSDTAEIKNIGISIENVFSGQTISSPLTVNGKANVFEGHVVLQIKDANGKVLGQSTATACMGLDACPFQSTITFSKPSTSYGTLETYSPSGKDGSKLYTQTVVVNF